MITFFIGIAVLLFGGYGYAKLSVKLFYPTDKPTPACTKRDNVDFVPMGKWRNALINLLNIAGTGPILGPIQGILFGPIAFLTIPIGCILSGAVHDYWCGMISVRCNGEQMPTLVERFFGNKISKIYLIFLVVLLLLVGVVFVYTPGDLFVGQVLNLTSESPNYGFVTVLVFAAIFTYYFLATMLPIDKIIGKIYPVFGCILFLSSFGIFAVTVFGAITGKYVLNEIWEGIPSWAYTGILNPSNPHYIPTFFVTVACGITSGFHSSQVTLISRTVKNEKDGSTIFFGMMCAEGFMAMCWAAGAMVVYNLGLGGSATQVVGLISKEMLPLGWVIPVAGVIILPITSGDTAFRAVRIILQDALHIDKTKKNNMLIGLCIFAAGIILLIWSEKSEDGFNILWRYFGFANQAIAVFSFAVITAYMRKNGVPFLLGLLPGTFYMFIVTSFILHQEIGFNISEWGICYGIGAVLSVAYAVYLCAFWRNKGNETGLSEGK